MEVTGNINEDDVIAFNDHLMRTLPGARRWMLFLWLLAPVIFGVLGVIASSLPGGVALGLKCFAFALFVLVLLPVWYRWFNRRWIRAKLKSGRNTGMFGQRKMIVSPREIGCEHDHGHSVTYWSGIDRIETSPEHAFFFVSATNAFIIPKRHFNDEAEFDYFVETARAYHEEAAAEASS